ncbi:LacI family DNA-binding transcriptional regulator [Arthrobacter sp. 9AX]|uniref:LacI family DNA-binding transcriptional regulator n=1 Tax=Arthrobacter sp. 9AX TaxID=2653131 RepID=UPI00135A90D5|nr:LacI family DNA-binding transcriptional regulator [Arthrobacter sp. 9AX]
MSDPCRMVDVAAAAAVSVSTVSNAINAPHLVKPETLARVRDVITELGYERNEQAFLLRRGTYKMQGSGQRLAATKTSSPAIPPSPQARCTSDAPSAPANGDDQKVVPPQWSDVPPGSHIRLVGPGSSSTGAIIDEYMPDGSCFWVWLDHGQGRKLIHRADDVTILLAEQETN